MLQAVEVEAQPEQKGLTHLFLKRATGHPSRKLSLHGREKRFDESTAPIELLRKRPPHVGAYSAQALGFLPALGRNHAARSKSLPDESVVPLAVEFCVGQHQPDARLVGSGPDERTQTATVVPRAAPCAPREQTPLIQVHHDQPFQPMPPRQRLLPVMMQAPYKLRAYRSLRQTRGVNGHPSRQAAKVSAAHPAHCFGDGPLDALALQTMKKAVQSCELGHAFQSQGVTQISVLPQPYLGFAKGSVFVPHQTENCQRLRLCELVLAEAASVRGSTARPTPRVVRPKASSPTSAIALAASR